MKYIKVSQAAEKWGISARRVRVLCAEGKIEGMIRKGKLYMIPENASKPSDGRNIKKRNTYAPNPIDTGDIELSADIMNLSELIAKNTHEVWAVSRIKDGWVYGDRRDDDKKQHPCLVPYEELDESEKKYDRNTSMEILKLIVKLGYNITKS